MTKLLCLLIGAPLGYAAARYHQKKAFSSSAIPCHFHHATIISRAEARNMVANAIADRKRTNRL